MRRSSKGWISALLALGILLAVLPAVAAPNNQFILRTKATAALDGLLTRHGLQLLRPLDNHAHFIYLVNGPANFPQAELEDQVKADAEVEGFEAVGDVLAPETPTGLNLNQSTAALLDALANRTFVTFSGDTAWSSYVNQPAAGIVNLPQVRPLATGGGIVAVIDTGVDPRHPVLRRWLVPGYDFVRDVPGIPSELADLDQSTAALLDQSTAALLDRIAVVNQSTAALLDQSTAALLDTTKLPPAFGHGTMVAGVVHLVAPTAQIMPLKAFAADGTATTFDILRAIYFAAENGARVINMSFSLVGTSPELMRAINFAGDRGVICVSSAGNTSREAPFVFPAAFRNVMGVASTDNLDARSIFSNYGAALVHLAAPGEAIVTTYPGGRYAAAWGTSFSAPFVAGASALLVQIDAQTGYYRAADDLAHAKQVPGGLGYGRLDVYKAVTQRLKSLGKL